MKVEDDDKKFVTDEELAALRVEFEAGIQSTQAQAAKQPEHQQTAPAPPTAEKTPLRKIFDDNFSKSVFCECAFLLGEQVPESVADYLRERGGTVAPSPAALAGAKHLDRRLFFLGLPGSGKDTR